MEKVTIKSALNGGKKWQEKPIIEVVLMDGREGTCFDDKIIEFIGKEIEMDVKAGKEYQGVQKYYFNFPKDAGAKKAGFPQRDYSFEKRKSALELTVSLINSGKVGIEKLSDCRDKFYEYLNTK